MSLFDVERRAVDCPMELHSTFLYGSVQFRFDLFVHSILYVYEVDDAGNNMLVPLLGFEPLQNLNYINHL